MKFMVGGSAAAAVVVLAVGVWLLMRTNEPKPAEAVVAVAAPPPQAVESIPEPVAPPPAAAAPAVADMVDVLKENATETNTEIAFAQLFSLWGGKFDPAQGRPCDQALQQGLECVYQQGSWGQLRTLNRPAILTLIDDSGNAHQVVIAGLNDGNASIDLKSAQREVSIASISRFWYGDYLVLWRPQVASPKALSAGMQGDGVRWLRQSLNSAQGRKTQGKPSDVYDQELVRMVEDFQRQHRLNVDGIAGVQTQIVLDTVNNSAGAPLLMAQTAGS
jgi:general secretion pathway protein A